VVLEFERAFWPADQRTWGYVSQTRGEFYMFYNLQVRGGGGVRGRKGGRGRGGLGQGSGAGSSPVLRNLQ
jgi:hypothetical protein